jgi:hypothetical protein
VNLSASGELTGYAYAANVGWILFEQTRGQPKLDFLSGKFTGYAYSANLGWIVLDTTASDLVTTTLGSQDVDGDGIGDAYEMAHCGTLTLMNATTDSDGDGTSDASEYAANTNPTDPADFLRITAHQYNPGFTTAMLTFTSRPSRLYTIEHDADLAAPWTPSGLGTIVPDAGATTYRSFAAPGGPHRFFRVVAHKPLQP